MPQYAAGQLAGPCEPESSNDPDPPWFAPRACRRAARAALGSMTRRAHRWALSPLAIVTSWLRSKRWLLPPAVPPQPADLSPDRRAAAIMTTFQPPTIMAATTSALPARIDHSAQLRNGRTRYLRGRILGRACCRTRHSTCPAIPVAPADGAAHE